MCAHVCAMSERKNVVSLYGHTSGCWASVGRMWEEEKVFNTHTFIYLIYDLEIFLEIPESNQGTSQSSTVTSHTDDTMVSVSMTRSQLLWIVQKFLSEPYFLANMIPKVQCWDFMDKRGADVHVTPFCVDVFASSLAIELVHLSFSLAQVSNRNIQMPNHHGDTLCGSLTEPCEHPLLPPPLQHLPAA